MVSITDILNQWAGTGNLGSALANTNINQKYERPL
jgi:hypothetical protein